LKILLYCEVENQTQTYVKVNGNWYIVLVVKIKINGEWKTIIKTYNKVSGSWVLR